MSKSSHAHFDEHASVLRFEDSDDLQAYPDRGNGYAPSSHHDDPFSELKQKQESLLRIRQELERTQRETKELEARQNKEERFNNGRREICEKLARSLGRLDRELYNSQKAIEEISAAREVFHRHLDDLRSIQPEAWKRATLEDELDQAIGAVEDAEDAFGKAARRLATVMPDQGMEHISAGGDGASLPHDFVACMRMGFAFTLPLILAAVIVLVLVKFLF